MALPLDVPESAQPRAVKAVKRMRVGLLSIVGQGAEKNSEFLIAQSAPDENDPILTICQEAYDAFDAAANETARHDVVDEFSAKLRNLIEPTVAQSEDGEDVAAIKARLGGWELHQGFREHLDTTVHSPADAEEALLDLHNVMREEIGLEPLAISTGDAMETEETVAQSPGAGVGNPKKEELHDATSATDVEGAEGAGGESPEHVESECPHCGSKTGGSAAIRKGKSGSGDAEAKGKAAMKVAQSEETPEEETPEEESSEETSEETTEETSTEETSTEEAAEETSEEGTEEAAEEGAELLEAPRASRKEDADGAVVAQRRLPPTEAKWANVFGQNPHTAQLVAQAADEYEGASVLPEVDSATPDIAAIVAQAVEKAVAATTEQFESRIAELTSRKATPAKSRQVDAEPAAPTVAQSTEKSVWQDGPLRGLFG